MTVNQGVAAPASSMAEDLTAARATNKWYLLAVITIISLMGTIDRGVISVIAEPLKADFLLSDKQIGLLSGLAYSVTFAVSILPMGWLIDRVNRRYLLSTTVLMWSGLTALCAASTSFTAMFIARMGVGAAEAPVAPASMSLIADTFPPNQRNTAVSIFLAGAGIGVLLQFVVGGWLLAHYGWQTVFLVAGGPGIILAALLFFTTREPTRGAFDVAPAGADAGTQKSRGTFVVLRHLLSNRAICFAIPAITVTTGVYFSIVTWTTSFLVRLHGLSISEGAILTGMGFGICMTIGSLIAGPIADRFSQGDPRKLALVPATATMIAAAAGALLSMAGTLPVALTGLAVVGLMAGFSLGPGYALILSLANPNERGTTMAGTKLITELLGGSVIAFATGAISDAVGGASSIRPALFCTAMMLLLATLGFLMVRRTLEGREDSSAIS